MTGFIPANHHANGCRSFPAVTPLAHLRPITVLNRLPSHRTSAIEPESNRPFLSAFAMFCIGIALGLRFPAWVFNLMARFPSGSSLSF